MHSTFLPPPTLHSERTYCVPAGPRAASESHSAGGGSQLHLCPLPHLADEDEGTVLPHRHVVVACLLHRDSGLWLVALECPFCWLVWWCGLLAWPWLRGWDGAVPTWSRSECVACAQISGVCSPGAAVPLTDLGKRSSGERAQGTPHSCAAPAPGRVGWRRGAWGHGRPGTGAGASDGGPLAALSRHVPSGSRHRVCQLLQAVPERLQQHAENVPADDEQFSRRCRHCRHGSENGG
ncbi:unnamed protein product [Rangifer tarandus platyrhynchus]|uniref:Uncharacterized protein n=1 Tax=Rangifer tarandus platyrhynchus TaxID=3082113 RepID=A0ABN8YV52_RANTA|nr:unnamed protein product [Rangifer tarandus platyrhynchus]